MHYEINKDGTVYHIEFTRENGEIQATVNGQEFSAEVRQPEPGLYVFYSGDHVHQARVVAREDGKLDVAVQGKTSVVEVFDKRRRESHSATAAGPQPIISPMPGRVVRILAQVGDNVEAGQGVVVVEAMKMQNEMSATKAGQVLEIHVTQGQTVKAGEVLAVVE